MLFCLVHFGWLSRISSHASIALALCRYFNRIFAKRFSRIWLNIVVSPDSGSSILLHCNNDSSKVDCMSWYNWFGMKFEKTLSKTNNICRALDIIWSIETILYYESRPLMKYFSNWSLSQILAKQKYIGLTQILLPGNILFVFRIN